MKARSRMAPVAMPPQDPGAGLSTKVRGAVEAAVEHSGALPGPLLPVLHDIQRALGYIPKNAVPLIAHCLNISRADVHGVISFYHFFRTEKAGKRIIYLCRAEACQANGCVRLEQHVRKRLGVDYHQTTADGRYTLEPVYCLGNCACGPAMMIDDEPHARVTPQRFDRLLGLNEARQRAKR